VANQVQIAVRIQPIAGRLGKAARDLGEGVDPESDQMSIILNLLFDLLLEYRGQHDGSGTSVLDVANISKLARERGRRGDHRIFHGKTQIVRGQIYSARGWSAAPNSHHHLGLPRI